MEFTLNDKPLAMDEPLTGSVLKNVQALSVGSGESFKVDKNGTTIESVTPGSLNGAITAAMTSIAAINPVDGEINYNKIGTLQIDALAVTEAKIAASAITASKTSIAAINPVDGEINANKVGSTQIDALAVTEAKIAADAVAEAKIAASAVTEGKISALAVTAGKIAANAVTADKIAAGAVTANKITSFNFQLSAGTFNNNAPSAGQISWSGVKVVYNGTEHTITNGNSNKKHIYWQLASPTVFSGSDSLPALGNDDFLVSFNNTGTNTMVWNSTVINGNRITAGSVVASNLAAGTITANEIATGAITADEIAAGAVTAVKLTTYNFLLSAGTFTNNSPSAGYVAWASCKVVYNGTEYTITNGNSNKKHIYWQLASPTVFAGSDTLPALGNDDFLVSFNNSGTNMFVWNSTVINGNRITAGSITASNLAASTITANEIAASTITAAKMNVATLSAISADLGTITAGTITGATIQTTATGYRVKMDSNNGVQLYNGATQVGILKADSGASVILDSDDNIYLTSGGSQMAYFTENSVDLPASNMITWAGQGRILGASGYFKVEGSTGGNWDLRVEGNAYPNSDNTHTCGASDKRWSGGWFEDISVDDLTVNTGCSGCGYRELNLLTKKQKDEFFEARKENITQEEIDRKKLDTNIEHDGDAKVLIRKEKKKYWKNLNVTGFELGDVLIWGKNGLEKCKEKNSPMVVGVSDKRGIPIVLGAEPIKVYGKVKKGDILVTGEHEGCAVSDNENNKRGTAIAIAMENSDGEGVNIIMAMINKF